MSFCALLQSSQSSRIGEAYIERKSQKIFQLKIIRRYPDVQIQLRDLQYEDAVLRFAALAFDNDSEKFSFEPPGYVIYGAI